MKKSKRESAEVESVATESSKPAASSIVRVSTTIPIFGPKLVVYFTDDSETVLKSIGIEDEDFIATSVASTTQHITPKQCNPCRLTMVFTYDTIGHGVIAHEIRHVVDKTMDGCGILYHKDENNEDWAHLTQYITGWVYRQIEIKGIKIERC